MRILHVASFRGNIGDNANHAGMRSQLAAVLPHDTVYDELEIRRAYRNYTGDDPLKFDNSFVDVANEYDLIIFGGGNFFEIWLEDSQTGCVIDLSEKVLDRITTPILFFGLGFDTYKGYSENTKDRFARFLSRLLASDQFMVTVRNDGSIEQLRSLYGASVSDQIHRVPDGGFFIPSVDEHCSLTRDGHNNIVFSIAEDMLHHRLPDFETLAARNNIIDFFSAAITQLSDSLSQPHFLLIPHIYSDVEIIASVIHELPDVVRRNEVSVGPCISGRNSFRQVFSSYKDSTLVLSMRFHGNVVPISFGVPTIGLVSYPKVRDLFEDLRLESQLFDLNRDKYPEHLVTKVCETVNTQESTTRDEIIAVQSLGKDMRKWLGVLANWLSN